MRFKYGDKYLPCIYIKNNLQNNFDKVVPLYLKTVKPRQQATVCLIEKKPPLEFAKTVWKRSPLNFFLRQYRFLFEAVGIG